MSGSEVQLSNVTAGGNVTGRDDNSVNINHTYEASAYIRDLYAKYQQEKISDTELQELCEELNFLNTRVQNEEVVGLENKLLAGGKLGYFIEYAEQLKEKYFKKLMKNSQYSIVAQDINVHILSKVKRTFIMEIFPMICRKEDEDRINAMISERIVNPVRTELGVNLFKYTDEDIMGMVFYLTGNCHIKWCA